MAELPLNRLGYDSDDELTDDEEETSPLNSAPSAPPEEHKPVHWDMFQDPPPPVSSMSEETEHFGATILKFAKLLTYLLTFLVVLSGAIIGKVLMLLMAAQLRPGRTTDLCTKGIKELPNRQKMYSVETTPLENMAWAYALLFAYIAPEVGAWIRALRMCFFKGFVKKFWQLDSYIKEEPQQVGHRRLMDTLVVILMESFHSVGTALLIYAVLPDLDSIRGAMLTNCLAFVPGFLGMFTRTNTKNLGAKMTIDVVSILSQLTGFVLWPLTMSFQGGKSLLQVWTMPFALLLTSFGWWENYVDHRSKLGAVSYLGHIKRRLWRTRYVIYLIVPVVKCALYFIVMVVVMGLRLDFNVVFKLGQSLAPHNLSASEVRVPLAQMSVFSAGSVDDLVPLEEVTYFAPDPNTPVYVFLVLMVSTWLSYVCGKFVCKIAMQQFSYSLPVNLVVPVAVCLLMTVCGLRTDDVCAFPTIPGYLFWAYEEGTSVVDFFVIDFSWLWFLWLLSQTWITIHIWTPKTEKLAKTEKIFVSPMYDSLLIDQSLTLNRRRDDIDEEKKKLKKKKEEEERTKKELENSELQWKPINEGYDEVQPSDRTTRIFACATMWHETPDEMEEFLKSVLRVDEDQSARRIARTYLKINDPDYYEYQTHVFFDDAFELSDDNNDYYVVNRYVKYLLGSMDVAASHVHHTIMRLRPPVRYPTPYGGRLVWTLPGKTKFIVHLKDKEKIRHKKRWSQVMYMYYLLGFKLMDQDSLPVVRKDVIAENTYLLALDGDIDFTARSVRLLVELMKKDANLGAACGRIHPVGSGLMVWYQKFEYAIGHWLQKATEHMIGCVLCSPGCFSIFRGSALMEDSVMRKYTTVSCKARHYVQYDQGEDRWLCTLLLKQGYRVEYSAASDAYTHCPEGFGEFYNQRRRWVPSTMANIMDVLEDYKLTVKINDSISMLYIAYQMMLMIGTILGPGTIFLMLVGALSAAFGMSDQRAFIFNLIPILAFMITCYFAKSATQLRLAYVLTAVYALLMCMVAIALAINIIEEGATTPTSIFLFATAASFIFTACLHPQEFWCLPCGLVYYLVVPSMYLLLQIYSCYNLNDVSWGTRDTPVKKTKEELKKEEEQLKEAQKKQSQAGWLGFLMSNDKKKERGSIECSLAGLFKIMCCVQPKPDQSEHILRSIDSLKRQLERMETHMGLTAMPSRRRSTLTTRQSIHSSLDPSDVPSAVNDDVIDTSDVESHTSAIKEERNDLINPFWMEDKKTFGSLGYKGGRTPSQEEGAVKFLTKTEVKFWEGVMDSYLRPLILSDEDKKKAAQDLLDLRNMAVFSFSMMNAIFVVIVALMQSHQDILYLNWPIGAKTNITYVYSEETPDEIDIAKDYVHLEPIGFVFVVFFGVVMVVQFIAMLFHRFGTFSQIIASTPIPCSSPKKKETRGRRRKRDLVTQRSHR